MLRPGAMPPLRSASDRSATVSAPVPVSENRANGFALVAYIAYTLLSTRAWQGSAGSAASGVKVVKKMTLCAVEASERTFSPCHEGLRNSIFQPFEPSGTVALTVSVMSMRSESRVTAPATAYEAFVRAVYGE